MDSAISLCYENFWVQYQNPTEPENLLAILRTITGSNDEAQKVMESMKSDRVKNKLTENTNDAFKDGAFGLPWFAATNAAGQKEGFWGIDHLGQLCDFLQLERPSHKGWRALL